MDKTIPVRIDREVHRMVKEHCKIWPFPTAKQFIQEAIIEKLTQAPTLKPRTTKP